MAKHFRSLPILDIRYETPDCISVSFQIPNEWEEEFQYKAGQNITLRSIIDGEEIRRSYSICSGPHEKVLRIAIKKMEEGKFSSYAFKNFHPGQVMDVMSPTGNFFLSLHPGNKKQYVAFAAGSGITPVISILKTILMEEPASRITLIYGNRNRSSVIFREELEALKNVHADRFQLIHIFSREKMETSVNEGRVDEAKCEIIFKHLVPFSKDQEFLLCGPAPMIYTVRNWLLSKHIPAMNLHFELFSEPGESITGIKKINPGKNNLSGEKSQVTIRLDGISADYQIPREGPTILEAAIQAGADLPYACRAGVCATCRAKLVEGKVTLDQNYALAEEELGQGFILACQAHPASHKLVIDFDIR